MKPEVCASHCPKNGEVVPAGDAEVDAHSAVTEVAFVIKNDNEVLGGGRWAVEGDLEDMVHVEAALDNKFKEPREGYVCSIIGEVVDHVLRGDVSESIYQS